MVIALQVRNLTKEFGNRTALENISFEVRKGEIFGIIGMSGSGKTTLLNHLIGFLEPSEGDIWYRPSYAIKDAESELKNLNKSMSEVKKIFGFAPQTPSFYPKLTIEENLIHFGSLYNLEKQAIVQNMQHLVALTKLEQHKDKLAEHLSGGMQRRLSIICGLIHKPEVLILDEPTADLDPVLSEETWNLIKEVNRLGTTVIVASHFLEDIEVACSRVAIIHNGALVACGTMDEIKREFAQSAVEIQIETKQESFAQVLAGISRQNVTNVRDKGDKLTLYTTKPEETLFELARLLRTGAVTARSLEVHRPTLREVFEVIALKDNTREAGK